MPKLETTLHLDMYKASKRHQKISSRINEAIKVLRGKKDIYGLEWGDPEVSPPLKYVRDHFLIPYLSSDTIMIEIGPGGGRWTRYMLHTKQIYAVDYHQEILTELKENFNRNNISFIKNNGADFPEIPKNSIDYIFSFGTFVHLEIDIINNYLKNMKPLLKQEANIVVQYSDKTKPLGKSNENFSDNNPDRMRELILSHGYSILEEDLKTMWHSSIVRFGLPR